MSSKTTLLLLSIFTASTIEAQINFQEATVLPDFETVSNSSIAFSDIDGDNDLDVLITGLNNSFEPISKLYTNDGSGNYTEVMDTPFEGVHHGSIAFADIDGDNDMDVLITGEKNSFEFISKLYTNDGNGNYTEVTNTPFEGVYYSSIAFADIDGDNDMDILITGLINSFASIAKLYTNDGNGDYTEVTDTPFEGVHYSSIAFADVDEDNDIDVLITGYNPASGYFISKLYTNDESGNYTEVIDTPFEGVQYSSIAFADVDGDNDLDVLITGLNSFFELNARLYTNDGNGSYTEVSSTPFEGVYNCSIAFADVDGDNDMDILITGGNISINTSSKLYTNDGNGNYTEVTSNPFEQVEFSSIAFADVDGDNDIDVLITGHNNSSGAISKLYFNHTPQAVFATDEQIACNTFTWIDDITYISDNMTAQHTLTGGAANGADSIVTLNLTVNSVSNISTSVDVATITANNENATYQWLNCDNDYSIIDGATEMSFSPTVNGNYAVEITENGNGCVDTTSCVSITSVSLIENTINNLVAYPNPTDGAFNISLQSGVEEIHITIVNMVGKQVYAETFSNTNSIDLELNQPSGIYFVEIRTKENSNTIQLIKK